MFQTILETENTNEDIANKKSILKNIIHKKYIFLYIITFMVSTINMGYNFSPFGLAIIAACISNEIPIIAITLIASIANLITSGLLGMINYIIIMLLFFVSFLLKEPKYNESTKNEKLLLARRLFFSTIIVSLFKVVINEILIYDILNAICLSILVVIFYKVFVNSLTVLTNYNEKMAFSIEEVLASSLLLAIAVCSLGDFKVLGFSVRNVISIFIVLFLGWKHGILIRNYSRCYNWSIFRNNCKQRTSSCCCICSIWINCRSIK